MIEFGGFPGKRFLPFPSPVLLAPPASPSTAPYVTQALAMQAIIVVVVVVKVVVVVGVVVIVVL